MPELPPNREVDTNVPRIEVTGPNNQGGLPPGRYTFRVEVIDDLGVRSAPDQITVVVAGQPAVRFRPITAPLAPNRPFVLEVEASTPNGVNIRQFLWTRLG